MAGGPDIIGYLEAGLKAAGLRGKVIAHNVANLNTPGFRRSEVRFEDLLARAMDAGEIDLEGVRAQVFQPHKAALGGDGNDVDLDKEVGQMIENAARSSVFLRALAKLYDQMELAASERV
jgi:flagellar basal-body rod protein FlgB